MIGTSKEKKIRCSDIRFIMALSDLVLHQLYDIGMDFKVLVTIARKLFVDRFGEPVGEGWICEEEDVAVCYKYVMIYRCVEDGIEWLAKVDVEEDYEHGFRMWKLLYDKPPIYDEGTPVATRLSIEVVEKKNDQSNKLCEIVKEAWGEEE